MIFGDIREVIEAELGPIEFVGRVLWLIMHMIFYIRELLLLARNLRVRAEISYLPPSTSHLVS